MKDCWGAPMSIVPQASQDYFERTSLRSLFSMLIALAMLFAPFGLGSGSAMATVPVADHPAQMMESGYCDEQPREDSQSDTRSCCVAMCTAIAVEPTTASEPHALVPSPIRPSLAQFDPSFLVKLPTPPPRRVKNRSNPFDFTEF